LPDREFDGQRVDFGHLADLQSDGKGKFVAVLVRVPMAKIALMPPWAHHFGVAEPRRDS
jgi:hypothetical protein